LQHVALPPAAAIEPGAPLAQTGAFRALAGVAGDGPVHRLEQVLLWCLLGEEILGTVAHRPHARREMRPPLATMIGGKFTNWTRSDPVLRQMHRIGIGFGDDVELAMRIIAQILADDPLVLEQPAPVVHLADYGEWAIQLDVKYYIGRS
jgi:hypothetical protein